MNVTLYIWPAADGLESSSPHCLKVIYALRHLKLPFKTVCALPEWTMTGRLPAAEIDGRRIEDSSVILSGFAELHAQKSDERAEASLLEDWCDDSFTLFMVYYRWSVDRHFERLAKQAFAMVPAETQDKVKRAAREFHFDFFRDRGIAQYSETERLARYADGIAALERRLQAHDFLVGDTVSLADFSVYAVLQVTLAAELDELTAKIRGNAGLESWLSRMAKLCQPA